MTAVRTLKRNKSNLHNWLFHYNIYTDNWEAVTREDHQLLFSDNNNERILKSANFAALTELIERTDGNKSKINQILKNGL